MNEWQRGEYTISTDRERLDLTVIHSFLVTSYWAKDIPIETLHRAIEHSLPFGLYKGTQQAGFARVVTDYATFAYLSDIFILELFRGKGLGQWLIEVVVAHAELQGLRRLLLATRDAHELYRKVGFTALNAPERFMEIWDPDVYARIAQEQGEAGTD